MKRIALVGVTGYGAVHFHHLSALADQCLCDFAAPAVVNPEHPDAAAPLSWLRAHGATVYPTAEALSVEGALYRARPEIETFDSCIVRFATDSGASVTIALSPSSDECHNPRIRVECERGTALWSLDGPWSIEGVASGTTMPPQEAMFRAMLGFVRDGGGGEANLCSLAMARAQVRAVELLTEKLRVKTLQKSAVRRDDGQWIVQGLPAFFDRVFETGDLLIPDWK